MKKCIGPCGLELELICFEIRKDTGKYRGECKNCRKEYLKAYVEANKEKVSSNHKNYYEANKESILQLKRENYEINKEEILEENKQYRLNNNEKIKENDRNRYKKNKKKISIKAKLNYSKNKEKILKSNKEYKKKNKEKVKKQKRDSYIRNIETTKRWRLKNKDKIARNNKEYKSKNKPSKKSNENKKINKRNKRKNNPSFRIREIISASINKLIKSNGSSKNNISCLSSLGKDYPQKIRAHIESLFEPWMTWENHGVYRTSTWDDSDSSTWTWNIDHIIPQSLLIYKSPNDLNCLKAWSLSNLRPLSAKENILKANKISGELYRTTMAKIEEELKGNR